MHYVFLWRSSVYVKFFLARKPVDTPCGVSRKREIAHGAYLRLSHHHVSFWNRSFVDLQILRERISECLPSFAKQVNHKLFIMFFFNNHPRPFSLVKIVIFHQVAPINNKRARAARENFLNISLSPHDFSPELLNQNWPRAARKLFNYIIDLFSRFFP